MAGKLLTYNRSIDAGCLILIGILGSSNVDRLRDFIKHVYVDRRFSGERTYDKPPRAKTVTAPCPLFRFTVLRVIKKIVTSLLTSIPLVLL